ncbi:Spy/CpxP family protein refolding chaperone [Noviherbaspirillum sp. ST9]|uniref:Spy/CpxP family protein refolding chaperone n=1 Tax=Noviherbaspirillum sp. ST9 TaxID=3401606 RepID=UPI003B58A328
MTTFRKRFLIGVLAAGLGAASFGAYADRGDCGPMGAGFGGHGRSPEKMAEHFDKRQSELHDKLKLNANQEGAWKNYMARIKPQEPPKRPDRAEIDKLPAPERMDRMFGFMQENEKRMADRIAATKEFYAVLTPEQKKVFDEEFRPGPGHRRHRG